MMSLSVVCVIMIKQGNGMLVMTAFVIVVAVSSVSVSVTALACLVTTNPFNQREQHNRGSNGADPTGLIEDGDGNKRESKDNQRASYANGKTNRTTARTRISFGVHVHELAQSRDQNNTSNAETEPITKERIKLQVRCNVLANGTSDNHERDSDKLRAQPNATSKARLMKSVSSTMMLELGSIGSNEGLREKRERKR